ncbi:hypothetical protein N7492_010132 [Penicillium capsulatum]|uniref:Uncharacterized protein n=1 Tax=Penicillium capsulatum TaxID=69766 RepID=A0A9W9LEZ9_9EURO|nr:hypothetical protein N7492_010132 [Penicillium capsulatum]
MPDKNYTIVNSGTNNQVCPLSSWQLYKSKQITNKPPGKPLVHPNGSYYYSNPNGSTYYNNGKGDAFYTPPPERNE